MSRTPPRLNRIADRLLASPLGRRCADILRRRLPAGSISRLRRIKVHPRSSIALRMSLFSWTITTLSILIFAAILIPVQKTYFSQTLEAHARSLAAEIRSKVICAAASDDFSEVVDYCLNTVSDQPDIDYFVITRCDGFSLVHTDAAWKMADLEKPWVAGSVHNAAQAEFRPSDLTGKRVYHYVKPIQYSGMLWGWIHVGLSLDTYEANVAALYHKTGLAALLCILLGFGAAVIQSRKLVQPLLRLQRAVERVSAGDLSVHTELQTRDEVASLAHAFNSMTAVLRKSHQQLVESKETAESASKSKSEFLANMSHEIRTPLNGVVGMLKLLTQTPLNPRQQRFVKQGILSSDALLTVINDILDFSKIEAGKMEVELVEFNVLEIVENVVQMFTDKTEEKGLELASLVYDNVPPVLIGDPTRIGQILINLMSNAVKFTATGEVILRTYLQNATEHDVLLNFDISDTGIGISKEKQEHIFEPFIQEDSSTTRRYGGTGLGLGISSQLAELMDGHLSVTSTPGKGSTFSLTIHLKNAEQERAEIHPQLTRKRVLLVEPHPTLRDILEAHLDVARCRHKTAACAADALTLLQDGVAAGAPFDLALISSGRPGLEALELGRSISRLDSISGTGLIMLAAAKDVDVDAYRQAGFAGYLTRPVKQLELYDVFSHVLAGRPLMSSAPQDEAPALDPGMRFAVKILLADDNTTNLAVAREILAMAGFECDTAKNGLEAIAAIEAGHYDIVFMDGMMPELDGYEATRRIRRMEAETREEEHLPIVALTANAMRGDRERCLASGMDDYLSKPIDPRKMISMIRKWCHCEAVAQPPAEPDPQPAAGGSAPLFDEAALLERCMNNAQLVDKLIEKCLEQTAGDLDAAQAALAEDDREKLAGLAHRMKGSSANLSFNRLHEAAAALENLARSGNRAESATAFRALQSIYEQTLRVLGERSLSPDTV